MKKTFLISSLLAAGFVTPSKAIVDVKLGEAPKDDESKSFFDVYRLDHTYNLAGHRSHSSHSSHRSHRSSSGGGTTQRVAPPSPNPPPTRNSNSTPPSSVLPSPQSVVPKTLPGNSGKFNRIVRELQTALYAYGYYTGTISGVVDSDTKAAIMKLQADYKLKITGTVTPEVLNALGIKAQ